MQYCPSTHVLTKYKLLYSNPVSAAMDAMSTLNSVNYQHYVHTMKLLYGVLIHDVLVKLINFIKNIELQEFQQCNINQCDVQNALLSDSVPRKLWIHSTASPSFNNCLMSQIAITASQRQCGKMRTVVFNTVQPGQLCGILC